MDEIFVYSNIDRLHLNEIKSNCCSIVCDNFPHYIDHIYAYFAVHLFLYIFRYFNVIYIEWISNYTSVSNFYPQLARWQVQLVQ